MSKEKYVALKELAEQNLDEFLIFLDKVSTKELDYDSIIEFLDSPSSEVVNAGRLLLVKHFGNKLTNEQVVEFLGSGNSEVRDESKLLIMHRFAQGLTIEELLSFAGSSNPAVRKGADMILRIHHPMKILYGKHTAVLELFQS